MNSWTKSSWFVDFVSTAREAVADALSQIEDRICRVQTDMFLQRNGLYQQPQVLTDKMLITELAKAMTRDRLEGRDLSVYEGVYSVLPAMRRIGEALFSAVLHEHVKIPPMPCMIVDGRIPATEFWDQMNKQVFVIPVDD